MRGGARVPFWLYVIESGISAASWAFLFTFAGWGFAEAALRILGHVRRYEVKIALGIIVAVVIAFYAIRKRRVGDEVVDALERTRKVR